jgi:hypothetical protein
MHPNMQPSRGTCRGYPHLACDKGNKLPFIVAHGSCMSSIGDSVGAASALLVWSHLVTEGVSVTQFTAG